MPLHFEHIASNTLTVGWEGRTLGSGYSLSLNVFKTITSAIYHEADLPPP